MNPGTLAVAACGLPLLAAVANGLNALTGGRLYGPVAVARVAVACVLGSFVASLGVAVAMIGGSGPIEAVVYRWIAVGELEVRVAFLVDELTVVMMLVVTAISALVTRFSVNYLHKEPGFGRYFTVVPLFVAAMLVLVMADNYLLLFLGWEGVGVCSYLLVAFYRDRTGAAQAGTRAFVMNRIGDAGLLVALFLLVVHTGSLRFSEVFAVGLPPGAQTAVCLLLLVGAIGKSAQLPLGTWLAQAMEGPTPSSALIHAATMVTAGVYLVVRSHPLYELAPTALLVVGLVGALTALYGQLVGYVQTDVKGMLAASTTAQLGLMFVLCGLGLYAVAIFHLVAHAFYKSYLFLTAPSILHHLHGGADPAAVARPERTAPAVSQLVTGAAIGLLGIGLLLPTAAPGLWALAALGVVAVFSVVFLTARMSSVSGVRAWPALVAVAALAGLGWLAGLLPGGVPGTWFQALLTEVAGAGAALTEGHPVVAVLFVAALVALLVSGVHGPRFLDRFRAELPAGAAGPAARRLYWWASGRGLLDERYARRVVAPTMALATTLHAGERALLDRPRAARGAEPAGWEARFGAARQAHDAGIATLAEPPSRLDWLPPPEDLVRRERLRTRWSIGNAAALISGAVETVERLVFQANVERVVSAASSGIARFIEAVEHLVFQSGVERGLRRAGMRTQRALLAFENGLGRPAVLGTLVAVLLVALVVGTR